LATAAVKGGHIRLNGDPVKPSQDVKPGDTVTIHTPGWDRARKVVNPITNRVGAKLAVEAYEDLSAPRPAYLSVLGEFSQVPPHGEPGSTLTDALPGEQPVAILRESSSAATTRDSP